jgi:hypothetical protein
MQTHQKPNKPTNPHTKQPTNQTTTQTTNKTNNQPPNQKTISTNKTTKQKKSAVLPLTIPYEYLNLSIHME